MKLYNKNLKKLIRSQYYMNLETNMMLVELALLLQQMVKKT